MGSLDNPPALKFTPINTATFTIAAGAAGWVDTDVSATTGTDVTKLWLVTSSTVTQQDAGVRPLGEASAPLGITNGTVSFLSYCGLTGHMEFYRNAISNVDYRLLGYLRND